MIPDEIRAAEGFDPGESAGLFVGVRQFDDERFAEVPFAVDDAVDLAHLFALDLELIAPEKAVLSLSGEPRKPESETRLQELLMAGAARASARHTEIYKLLAAGGQATGPRGLYVVALATHGFSDQGNDFLVASDSLRRRIVRTGVAVNELFDDVARATAPRRFVLLDACRERLWAGTRAGGADAASAMSQSFADAIAGASGLVVLSGTTLGGYSYDDLKAGNGVFTGAVIDGLRGQAPADERCLITVRALADYVSQRVTTWVRSNWPDRSDLSRDIAMRIEGPAADMPLAVDPSGLRAAEEFRRRRDMALDLLRENIGGPGDPIPGRLYDEIASVLAPDLPRPELLELLVEVEALDGTVRSRRSLAYYFNEHRERLQADRPRAGSDQTAAALSPPSAPAVVSSRPKVGDVWEDPVLGMRFRYIPPGRFQMGSPESEEGRDDDETLHEVELTRGFWMAETAVTQGEWRQLMGNNPSGFAKGNCPVEQVNWFETVAYANALSERAGLESCYKLVGSNGKAPGEGLECKEVRFTGLDCLGYRLPTEAEWEYAARAGTTTPFWSGDNLTTDQANYDGNYPYVDHPKGEYRDKMVAVRSFEPNPWGLYEVHGNVWEWVWDWDGDYPTGVAADPLGPAWGSARILRGGSWRSHARNCRAADRGRNTPGNRSGILGFRLVRTSE